MTVAQEVLTAISICGCLVGREVVEGGVRNSVDVCERWEDIETDNYVAEFGRNGGRWLFRPDERDPSDDALGEESRGEWAVNPADATDWRLYFGFCDAVAAWIVGLPTSTLADDGAGGAGRRTLAHSPKVQPRADLPCFFPRAAVSRCGRFLGGADVGSTEASAGVR